MFQEETMTNLWKWYDDLHLRLLLAWLLRPTTNPDNFSNHLDFMLSCFLFPYRGNWSSFLWLFSSSGICSAQVRTGKTFLLAFWKCCWHESWGQGSYFPISWGTFFNFFPFAILWSNLSRLNIGGLDQKPRKYGKPVRKQFFCCCCFLLRYWSPASWFLL